MNRHSMTLRIAVDHPALAGHFPGSPIVPGVVLLDEALHAIERVQPGSDPSASWCIDAVKFHRVARPGDTLRLDFEWQADGLVHFEMRVASVLVASGTVTRRARIRAVLAAR